MKYLAFFAATLLYLGPECSAAGQGTEFIDVATVVPGIVVALPYATADNFLKRQIYPENKCYLRKAVAERLAKVQADLEKQGYGLMILDGYRPPSAQREMWKILPDSRYVANPANGSRHNRGAAVDVTLVTSDKKEVEMPTKYDDFSAAAHVTAKTTKEAAANRALLQNAMKRRGFVSLATEWWHFDAPDWKSYPIEEMNLEKLGEKAK